MVEKAGEKTGGKIGRVSNASVLKCTGKGWAEWLRILEKAGAKTWTHGEIADFLKAKYRLRPWWQQGVAMGFEIATGRRQDGESTKGLYTTTATKSLRVPAKRVWKFLVSKEGKAIWLSALFDFKLEVGAVFETEDGFYGEVRTIRAGNRIRLSWRDQEWEKATFVQVTVYPKPKEKSLLCVDHGQIKDLRTKTRLAARWRAALDRFGEVIGEARE